MKKLLLVTTLLSVALSENVLAENYPRTWMNNKKLNGKTNHMLRDDIISKFDEFSSYNDNRQLPRISDTQFISEKMKLPSVAVIRRPDSARFSQDGLLSPSNSKFGNTKPAVLISIDIQEITNAGDDVQEGCAAKKKNRKPNQDWQFPQPFYVEEPRWIEIDSDYMDGSTRNSKGDDPYILTRGKKIFRINDPNPLGKMIEDYEKFLDYSSIGERLTTRNRVRRGADETDEKSQNDMIHGKDNQEEEPNRYNFYQDIDKDTNKIAMIKTENEDTKSSKIDENSGSEAEKRKDNQPTSVHDIFIKRYEEGKLKNIAKISPHERKFAKGYQISTNGITITDSVGRYEIVHENNPSNIETGSEETVKTDRSLNNLATDMNKENKKLMSLKNKRFIDDHKKRESFETEWKNSDEGEKVTKSEQMENNAYKDEMEDFGTYKNLFILSRGKKPIDNEAKSSNGNDTNGSVETRWKDSLITKRYQHHKNYESKGDMRDEEDETERDIDDIETEDTRPTSKLNSRNSEIKDRPNQREKRNVYETRSKLQRLRNMKKEHSYSPYLRPRDKHSKIDNRLLLPADPFFIIRGKKIPQKFEGDFYSMTKLRNAMNDANFAKMIDFSTLEKSSCNNRNYDFNIGGLSKNKPRPRDRRGSLDKILNLETLNDPFYLVRGKRISTDDSRSNWRWKQNRMSSSSESDVTRKNKS